jgi:hypothetical protein
LALAALPRRPRRPPVRPAPPSLADPTRRGLAGPQASTSDEGSEESQEESDEEEEEQEEQDDVPALLLEWGAGAMAANPMEEASRGPAAVLSLLHDAGVSTARA